MHEDAVADLCEEGAACEQRRVRAARRERAAWPRSPACCDGTPPRHERERPEAARGHVPEVERRVHDLVVAEERDELAAGRRRLRLQVSRRNRGWSGRRRRDRSRRRSGPRRAVRQSIDHARRWPRRVAALVERDRGRRGNRRSRRAAPARGERALPRGDGSPEPAGTGTGALSGSSTFEWSHAVTTTSADEREEREPHGSGRRYDGTSLVNGSR